MCRRISVISDPQKCACIDPKMKRNAAHSCPNWLRNCCFLPVRDDNGAFSPTVNSYRLVGSFRFSSVIRDLLTPDTYMPSSEQSATGSYLGLGSELTDVRADGNDFERYPGTSSRKAPG
eukprot:gb/GECG01006880.1/.p1 GENE.gb/GECG01006880.1/~~gb/GECG01006880.1/.p1  ORF type:complete len:119 (+),score=9.69 gb/GECG01006880.1/:1-357(+)